MKCTLKTCVVVVVIQLAAWVSCAAAQDQPATDKSRTAPPPRASAEQAGLRVETKDLLAALAIIVSVTSLTISILQRRRERIESVIAGLRGDRRAVTYAANTIRLSNLLGRDDYRHSLIASLLLAWNFETSDRARAAVLAALVDAKEKYAHDYAEVLANLAKRFVDYERVVPKGDMNRGKRRLDDVRAAVEAATKAHQQTETV